MTGKVFILLFTFLLSVSTLILAQETTGKIEGRIVDSTGTPLYGVNISLQSENLQGMEGTSTNDDGFFRIFGLPIGFYKVKISFIGYGEIVFENVQINLGKTTNLGEIQLQVQTYDLPEVIISGEKFIIDPTSTTYGGNLNSKSFENLPVDRDYQSMISLLPQANTSYYGDAVNIGGATGFENKYFVDGVEVTDPLLGNAGTNLPYNFIKEIEVKTGGYEAEFRSSLGGLINVITYSGTNEFRGSVFGFYTNNRFGSKRHIGSMDLTQGNFSNYDIGVSLGGPIIRDKLWFFAAYNPTFNQRDVDVPSFGVSVDRTIKHSFASKLTWSTSNQLRLILTFTGDPTERKAIGYNFAYYPLLNPDSWLQDLKQGGFNASLNGTYSIGQNILLRASFSRIMRYDSGDPSTAKGKDEILFYDYQKNIWAGGTYNKWDHYRYSNVAKLGGTISLGKHILNAGIEYKIDGSQNPEYNDVIAKWDSANWEERIGIGGNLYQRSPSVFIQDSWQIIRSLSIHGGIRWDAQFLYGTLGILRQKIQVPLQPRVGFTFVPNEDGSQKISGSYGRFAQELSLQTPVWSMTDEGSYYVITYDHDPRLSNAGGDTVFGGPHLLYNPREEILYDQYFDEFSLGYEQSIGGNFLVSMQAIYRTLREAISSIYNPGKGIQANLPRPKRNYTSLIITIEQRKGEHFNFLTSYVLSRDYGNYGGLFDAIGQFMYPNSCGLPSDLEQVQKYTGPLPNDRTHVFKFSGSYKFSFGLTAGLTFLAESGTPLSELGSGIEYYIFMANRGSAGRTPAIWDLNARLIYDLASINNWNPRLILDVFHIASQRKPVDIDQYRYLIALDGNFYPSPTYGQVYRYQPAMSVRLGMEVNF